MANKTIDGYNAAVSIDGAADQLLISQATVYNKINRNTLLNLTSGPVGLTDIQTLTNKTLTSPTINGATLSGTLIGTYTLGGTPTFPASVITLTGTQVLTNKTLTSPTITSPTITNASISTDVLTGFTVSNSGTVYGITVAAGAVTLPSSLSVTGASTLTGNTSVGGTLVTTGQLSAQTGVAPPAAGASTAGIKLSSTANLGLFFGAGAPTFTAAQGSIYINTTGSSISTRLYVNTTGLTTWTNFTSGA